MSDLILSVRNLRVVFPHRHGELVPIDDISFDIRRGEIIGFVGESGAGKSMTGLPSLGLLIHRATLIAGRFGWAVSVSISKYPILPLVFEASASAWSFKIR